LYYALIFASNGAYFSYISLYYADISLDNMQIGILTAVTAIVSLFGQPLWGIASDRAKFKNHVLILCVLISTFSIWLIQWSGNAMWLLIVFTALFSLFHSAVAPLSDAISLELAEKQKFSFSHVRAFGSLGFALMSVAAGWMFQSGTQSIFLLFFIVMLGALALSFTIPRIEGHQSGGRKVGILQLFNNKQLVAIYAFSLVLSATMGFFFSFQAVYSEEVGIGTDLIGLGLMIGSFSQFPFMLFFDKWYRRFGILNILLASGVIHAVRWLLYATSLTPVTMLLLWILHGGTFILFYLCLAEYVNRHVMMELQATGQMMNAVITNGISRIIGGFLGGWYASEFGFQSAFFAAGWICVAATIGFYLTIRYTRLFQENSKTAASA